MITKSCGVEWIGDIPQEWEISRIKYVSDFQPTCDTSMLTNESIVTYTPMEYIKNGYYIKNDSPYGKLSSSLTQYCEGDIVMAKVTPCFENGNIAIMTNLSSGIGMGSSELFVFRAKRINVKYLFYWLRNTGFVNAACATMTGTGGLKRVSPYFVYNSVICYPKNNEYQQRIVEFLDRKCAEIDSVISKTKATIEQYKALKQSVITQAVTKGIRPDRPMKDSGIEWIGEIPQEWEVRRIKTLFSLRDERNDKPLSDVNLISLYTDLGVVQRNDVECPTGNKASNADGYKLVYKNDIVVNIILCWMGAIGRSDYNGVTSPAYDIYIPSSEANPYYYHYYFRTQGFNGDCYKRGKGIMAMRWRTYSDEFRDIRVVYPSVQEQQKIADYLDRKCSEIDRLIAAKEQLLTELESYKKSVIYEYVTGKKEV